MSVRVTERLIGDVVIATAIPKSPLMVVQAINEETKLVSTIWFSANNECQQGSFPGSSLDRAELPGAPAKVKKAAAAPKAAPGRGRKPAK